jgi:hypothetical protein
MPTAYIIWGESPDEGATPVEYNFQTDAELEAFFLGISEAEGWMGYTICDGKDYVVNERGDVVSSLGQAWLEKAKSYASACYVLGAEDVEDYIDFAEKYLEKNPEEWVDDWAKELELPLKEA